MTEKEIAVRNLSGELSVMESCLNLEKAKTDRFQDRLDEDRQRYEQRLSSVMANPSARDPGVHTVDV